MDFLECCGLSVAFRFDRHERDHHIFRRQNVMNVDGELAAT